MMSRSANYCLKRLRFKSNVHVFSKYPLCFNLFWVVFRKIEEFQVTVKQRQEMLVLKERFFFQVKTKSECPLVYYTCFFLFRDKVRMFQNQIKMANKVAQLLFNSQGLSLTGLVKALDFSSTRLVGTRVWPDIRLCLIFLPGCHFAGYLDRADRMHPMPEFEARIMKNISDLFPNFVE